MAFKIAAGMAFRQACQRAGLVLLEPVMRLEVVVPECYMGELIGDLNARRGRIEAIEPRVGLQVIRALAPMAELFGYATALRSITQGRGNYTMHFGSHEAVPKAIGEEVVARISGTYGR
jgi:elongation factor G